MEKRKILKQKTVIFCLLLFLLNSIYLPFVAATVQHWEDDSSYSYYEDHKIGATVMGVDWETNLDAGDFPRVRVGVAAGLGNSWEDDPLPGDYYTEAEWFECKITATDVFFDADSDGIKDSGEGRSTSLVYFDMIHTAECGSDDEWDELVGYIYSLAQYLSGVALPFPFDLLTTDTPDVAQTTITYSIYDPEEFAALRVRVDYEGWDEGDHYITFQTRTKVMYYVWHEPADKRSASVVDTEYITITKNITMKIVVPE